MAVKVAAAPKTAALYVVEQLAAWGCQRIYGVTGDAILHLMDALAEQNEIRYVGCRLEATAALMASAEAKLTGKLAVCTATSGPGIAGLLNGLGDAALDRAPVLVITGQVERKQIGTGAKQDVDQQLLIQPLAVYSAMVADVRAIPAQLNRAAKMAVERGGVAHLSVPKEVWTEMLDAPLFPPPVSGRIPTAVEGEIQQAVRMMDEAQRPVILAGRGVKEAQRELLRFAEKIRAPIMTTLPARSYVPNDHPLYVGVLGQAGSDIASDVLKEADLCILMGATWWPEDYVPASVPLVQVDAAPGAIGQQAPVAAPVVGDLPGVLTELIRRVAVKTPTAWHLRLEQMKELWRIQIETEAHQDSVPLAPQRVMAALNRTLAEDAVIALDVGDHVLWFSRIFQAARQDILVSGRWRTLGFGLPAAMAAKLARPDRQAVALVGDGGFGTTMVDLITAVGYEIPVRVIIMNNGSFAMERNRMVTAGLHSLGSGLFNPDFSALARAFGAEGHRVERPDQLEPVLEEAFRSPNPAVVDICCDDPVVPHTKI